MIPHRVDRTGSPAPRHSLPDVMRPAISFVTVTFGTPRDVIDRSLGRLVSALRTEGVAGEIVVVDNPHPTTGHSTAHHVALTTDGVLLVQPRHNLGFGGGNDLGVMYARADVLGIVNPDLYVHDGWLGPLLDEVRRRPAAVVAPRLIEPGADAAVGGQRVMRDGRTRSARADEAPHYASAACWLMQRTWYDRVGGFDPRFHPAYFEDVDFAFRSARLGGELVISDVGVQHGHGESTPGPTPDISRQHRDFADRWRDDLRYVEVGVDVPSAAIAAMAALTS